MMNQLDLFEHSRDVMLRNDLAGALLRGDIDAARAAARALHSEFGADAALAPAEVLTSYLTRQLGTTPDARFDAPQILAARRELAESIAPAAVDVLGAPEAAAWLADQRRRLAQHAAHIPWRCDLADAHAAALFAHAGAWDEVVHAVQRIESWRRIPQPLQWMAQARWRLQGADAGWPLLAELAWLAPPRAQELLASLARRPDAKLERLRRRFEEDFDPTPQDWAWLPAWALVEEPLLAAVLDAARPTAEGAPHAGFRLVLALLRLERQGRHHEIVEHRRRLRSLSAPLFAAYMRTR